MIQGHHQDAGQRIAVVGGDQIVASILEPYVTFLSRERRGFDKLRIFLIPLVRLYVFFFLFHLFILFYFILFYFILFYFILFYFILFYFI